MHHLQYVVFPKEGNESKTIDVVRRRLSASSLQPFKIIILSKVVFKSRKRVGWKSIGCAPPSCERDAVEAVPLAVATAAAAAAGVETEVAAATGAGGSAEVTKGFFICG